MNETKQGKREKRCEIKSERNGQNVNKKGEERNGEKGGRKERGREPTPRAWSGSRMQSRAAFSPLAATKTSRSTAKRSSSSGKLSQRDKEWGTCNATIRKKTARKMESDICDSSKKKELRKDTEIPLQVLFLLSKNYFSSPVFCSAES